jgi:hypothetical protein
MHAVVSVMTATVIAHRALLAREHGAAKAFGAMVPERRRR